MKLTCDACGNTRFYAHYEPEQKSGWFTKGHPERMRVECDRCFKVSYRKPGSLEEYVGEAS
jgi:hypothetical protein